MTDGKCHDIRVANSNQKLDFALLPDSIISIDKAYIDYRWLYSLNKRQITFVTRAKNNMEYKGTGQHKPIKKKQVVRDDMIRFTDYKSRKKYPEELRIVGYIETETGKHYEFLTNNLKLAAKTIAGIYKSRWQIELFFKWIKQNLKIKSFLGTSPNAVLTQVWVAMCYYLLLTYIKYQTKYSYSLTELGRMIGEVLMELTNLVDILSLNAKTIKKAREPVPQLVLF